MSNVYAPNQTTHPISPQHPVAYFSAEYGFDARIPIYAGGLGILSGDTMKQAGEENYPFIGFGLLYKGKLVKQHIDQNGWQHDYDWHFDPTEVGLEPVIRDDQPLFIQVKLVETDIWLNVWRKKFSDNAILYLLDADIPQNHPHERTLTQYLYTGSIEYQMKQQLLFTTGAITLLRELEIEPALYHINEGRPAFIAWELIREYKDRFNVDYYTAKKLVKDKTVYTNHTLVAAGNQGYPTSILSHYAKPFADAFGLSTEQLLSDGIEDSADSFQITRFALNSSSRANGVSQLHSKLSQDTWPEYHWSNVTNGVHMKTWQDPEILANKNNVDELWKTHSKCKEETMQYVLRQTGFGYDPNKLVFVWARRLAGYKQLDSLVSDIERFRAILKNKNLPAQLLVAGKSHQGDTGGKEILQQMIKFMSRELAGSALFIPNYNIEIAQHLTRGSDLWVNTPIYGREACGTSGMKAISNGVLQCTVADGWAAEASWDNTGWIIDQNNVSESFYSLMEQEITPLFYSRNENGVPLKWVEKMQRSIALSEQFGADKMLAGYKKELYQA